jgi:1-deoxy-D-xylulose-5-phosphate reductoisomerase
MRSADRKNVVVLGSTGSVGRQTLDVIRHMPDRFRVLGLSAHSRCILLGQQVREFTPEAVALADPGGMGSLKAELDGCDTEILSGPDGLARLAEWQGAQVIVSSVSGAAGVPAAVAALRGGKALALANKESVVMCGPLLNRLAEEHGSSILPVDSEHSAVFQLLNGVSPEEVNSIVLTASGGPFYGRDREELARVTPEEALRHPTWSMGRKISVDSATLMNKALEVIEARWLFGIAPDRIQVVIHPQSIIHCMVKLVDGSCLAHMGVPDMRLPIQYALNYPERTPGQVAQLDLAEMGRLEFYEPDEDRFPALWLGYRVAREGGTSGAVLCAAGEVAVRAFLDGRIGFQQIVPVVRDVLDRHDTEREPDLADILAAEEWARQEAESCLQTL